MMELPTPVVDDPDTGRFFAAAGRWALAVQFCGQCDKPVHLPRPRCPFCGSAELIWRDVAVHGRIYSWTVVRHQVHPAFAVPYTIMLVELTEHPEVRLIGYLDGEPRLQPGQPVDGTFELRGTDTVIPLWHPTHTAVAPHRFNEGDPQ